MVEEERPGGATVPAVTVAGHAHGVPVAQAGHVCRGWVSAALWALVLSVVAGAVAGVVVLWPGTSPIGGPRLPADARHAQPFAAVVTSVSQGCSTAGEGGAVGEGPAAGEGRATGGVPGDGDEVDRLVREALQVAAAGRADAAPAPQPGEGAGLMPPGGDDAAVVSDPSCLTVRARLADGPERGRVEQVQVPRQILPGGVAVGQRVSLARLAPSSASGPPAGVGYAWADYARGRPLLALGAGFLVVLLLVARWRGITALAGLALGYLALVGFVLPALQAGRDPVAVALCGSVSIMVVVLYVAHGVSARTTTALLGTVACLLVSAGLAWWVGRAAELNGTAGDDAYTLSALPGGLSGVVVCGLVLASLGVLNDVTVTQASAVWEIAAHAPHLGVKDLVAGGMRVGRDHLASAVYTIAFAYAGAALPTLMLVHLFDPPWSQVLTGGEVAEEVARTLVGAVGLVLAVPVTTALAAVVVVAGTRGPAVAADPPPQSAVVDATVGLGAEPVGAGPVRAEVS